MTADDTTPQTSAFGAGDTVSATPKSDQSDVIEQAARAIHDTACDCGDPHPCDYAAAHAVADAHLLADPADRDELIHAREVAELAEKDRRTYHQDAIRAEAEVARLKQQLAETRAEVDAYSAAQVAVLRATVDRVRALINDPEAASLRHHANGDFTWVIEITALNAALDGGEQS